MQLHIQARARVDLLAPRVTGRGIGEQVHITFNQLDLGLRAARVGLEQGQRGLQQVWQFEGFIDDQGLDATLCIGQSEDRDELARRRLQLQSGLVAVAGEVAGNGLATRYRQEVAAQLLGLEL
ncbi:hypothetical protein D3C80_1229940 [compost metagenome]